MTLEDRLNDDLKANMRSKNADAVACIHQIKSKIQDVVNAKGFNGAVDDALYQQVIAAYCKSLQKAATEMEAAGERSAPLRQKYAAEVAYLARYMPAMMDEQQTREQVRAVLASSQITDPKHAGKVLGALMKEHKGRVDPALARRIVQEELGG